MAEGVILLLDDRAEHAVLRLWKALEEAGIPSLATHSHRRHQPHITTPSQINIPALGPIHLPHIDIRIPGVPAYIDPEAERLQRALQGRELTPPLLRRLASRGFSRDALEDLAASLVRDT